MTDNKGRATISTATLANLLHCDERTVRKLAARGIVVRDSRGRFALAASVRNYVRHLRHVGAARIGSDPTVDPVKEAALLRRSQREGQELKNQILASRCVSLEDAHIAWARFLRVIRGNLSRVPKKIGSEIPDLTPYDLRIIGQLCQDSLDDAGITDTTPGLKTFDRGQEMAGRESSLFGRGGRHGPSRKPDDAEYRR